MVKPKKRRSKESKSFQIDSEISKEVKKRKKLWESLCQRYENVPVDIPLKMNEIEHDVDCENRTLSYNAFGNISRSFDPTTGNGDLEVAREDEQPPHQTINLESEVNGVHQNESSHNGCNYIEKSIPFCPEECKYKSSCSNDEKNESNVVSSTMKDNTQLTNDSGCGDILITCNNLPQISDVSYSPIIEKSQIVLRKSVSISHHSDNCKEYSFNYRLTASFKHFNNQSLPQETLRLINRVSKDCEKSIVDSGYLSSKLIEIDELESNKIDNISQCSLERESNKQFNKSNIRKFILDKVNGQKCNNIDEVIKRKIERKVNNEGTVEFEPNPKTLTVSSCGKESDIMLSKSASCNSKSNISESRETKDRMHSSLRKISKYKEFLRNTSNTEKFKNFSNSKSGIDDCDEKQTNNQQRSSKRKNNSLELCSGKDLKDSRHGLLPLWRPKKRKFIKMDWESIMNGTLY